MENEILEKFLELEKNCKQLLGEKKLFKVISTVDELVLVELLPRKGSYWGRIKNFLSPINYGKYIGEMDYLQHVANCKALSEFILRKIQELSLDKVSWDTFDVISRVVDDCYLYVKKISQYCQCIEERKKQLQAVPLSMKLGGKIPVSYLLDGKNEKFVTFIQKNHLQHSLFALRLFLPFDKEKGPSIPVAIEGNTTWVPWKEIREEKSAEGEIDFYWNDLLLFQADSQYILSHSFNCLYKGIMKYSIYKEGKFIPFDRQDPSRWDNKHILEIWTVSQNKSKPSMFFSTHAFMILKDSEGNLYSVGQDSVLHLPNKINLWEVLSTKPALGLLPTPDLYVVYPKNVRQFRKSSFEITREQLDKIIKIVEEDQRNNNRMLSFGKKNCVTYVIKILEEVLGIKVDPTMYVSHILLKSALPSQIYRFLYRFMSPAYQLLPLIIKRSLFFLPFYYPIHILLAILVQLISQKNIPGHEDYTFFDTLIRPWNLSAHHPLQLHRRLEKLTPK